MFFRYYFLINAITGGRREYITEEWLGGINDICTIDGDKYIIDDYAEEWTELN